MSVPESVAFEAIAIHLAHKRGDLDDAEFVEALARLVEDVETKSDVFSLLLRVSTVATGATVVAAKGLGRTPESLLQDGALLFVRVDE